jgi:hypothetical protein
MISFYHYLAVGVMCSNAVFAIDIPNASADHLEDVMMLSTDTTLPSTLSESEFEMTSGHNQASSKEHNQQLRRGKNKVDSSDPHSPPLLSTRKQSSTLYDNESPLYDSSKVAMSDAEFNENNEDEMIMDEMMDAGSSSMNKNPTDLEGTFLSDDFVFEELSSNTSLSSGWGVIKIRYKYNLWHIDMGENCIALKNWKENKTNGHQVVLKPCKNYGSYLWRYDSLGRLVNKYGKCMEAGKSGTLHSKMFLWNCHSGMHQRWELRNDYRIKNRAYNKYIGIRPCRPDWGVPEVVVSDYTTGYDCKMSQMWYI